MKRRFWLLYPTWIAFCAILFVAFSHAEDPSRRHDRILSGDAGNLAAAYLQRADPARYRGYEPVHVAYAGKGEAGAESRWVVLCDRLPHTALRAAVVVELRASDGAPLLVRKPR
ncbi:MAG: hypothetical protein JWN02_1687 [Acidobacteria bacterium]|nr:hypothetical protein [Acidobacteriota bacterium]